MKCKYCNAEIENDARFCPNCGKDLSRLTKCINCGEFLDDEGSYCPHCGTKQPDSEENADNYVEEYQQNHSTRNFLIAFCVLFALIGGILYFTMQKKSASSDRSSVIIDSTVVDTAMVDTAAVDTLAEEYNDSNEMHTSEYVAERIKNMYGKEVFIASDFSRLRKKVKDYLDGLNSDDYNTEYFSNVEWIDFWFVGDDGGCGEPELSIEDVQINDNDGSAVARWYYKDCDCYAIVSLSLVFENDDWYVDDVNSVGCSGSTIKSVKRKTIDYLKDKATEDEVEEAKQKAAKAVDEAASIARKSLGL